MRGGFVGIVDNIDYRPIVGDPDDHRPDSALALLTDPGGPTGAPVEHARTGEVTVVNAGSR